MTAPVQGHASPTSRAALVAVLVAQATLAACVGAPRRTQAPAPETAPATAPAAQPAPAVDVGAVEAIRDRLLADSADPLRPTLPEPRYALDLDVSPFESHDLVTRYVTLFTGEGKERFSARLQRGTRYDGMIRRRLRDAGLPEDLTYLALVESGYDPNAVSHASAVGMWQFMAGTAREIGLRVDWWVDERRDPVKSTDAAVKNLRWLRKQFGSLFLAAAAYNSGEGRVTRGLAQLAANSDSSSGEDRFFALADGGLLRTETTNYVPQIIAAALVAGEPARYGIAVEPLSPFLYDSAFVRALTPLAAVADAAHATHDELLDLNPQLLRGMTPPGEATLVRIPAGSRAGFEERLADESPSARRAFRGVETRSKETLERIASREHVPTAELRRFNPRIATVKKGKRKGTLVPGQTLRIPSAAVLAYARPVGDVDGDGPTALPTPIVAAEPAKPVKVTKEAPSVRSAEDGGDVEPDAPKPPKHAKAVAKRSAKPVRSAKPAKSVASTRSAKSAAKPKARTTAKTTSKASSKTASKPTSKPVAKSTKSGKAKSAAPKSAKAKSAKAESAKARSTKGKHAE